jgi:hypothetical protein
MTRVHFAIGLLFASLALPRAGEPRQPAKASLDA